MSMFHWHTTDQHSFPLKVTGFTELAIQGAYSANQVYTDSDIKDIISYANV
jgi:hexosaminidase